MSYEHCHENAQEEAAKMLGTCSLATEFKWHRHSCLCAVAKPRTRRIAKAAASLPAKIPWPPWRLIANLELKLRLTHRKISPLGISNRKYFAISNRTWLPRPKHACHSLQFAPNCNSNRDTAIRTPPNSHHLREFQISNRDKTVVFASSAPGRNLQLGSRPQIDRTPPHAYTYILPKEKPSWKTPSY
jgi:hypothetical protein